MISYIHNSLYNSTKNIFSLLILELWKHLRSPDQVANTFGSLSNWRKQPQWRVKRNQKEQQNDVKFWVCFFGLVLDGYLCCCCLVRCRVCCAQGSWMKIDCWKTVHQMKSDITMESCVQRSPKELCSTEHSKLTLLELNARSYGRYVQYLLPALKLTWPLKMDAWNTIVSF